MQATLENFMAAAKLWSQGHTHVLCSAFVLKADDSRHLIVGKIIGGTYPELHPIPEVHYESDRVIVVRALMPLVGRTFDDFLDEAVKGMITTKHGTFTFPTTSGTPNTFVDAYARFGDGHNSKQVDALRVEGPQHSSTFAAFAPRDTLDLAIKTGAVPYDGLKELLTRAGLWEQFADRPCNIEVIALAPASIADGSTVRGGTLILSLSKSEGLAADKIGVGYVVYTKGGAAIRERVEHGALNWQRSYEGARYEMTLFQKHFPGAVSAKVFLSYGEGLYDERWLEDRDTQVSTLTAAYQVYDPENAALIRHLDGKGKDPGRDFEAAVHQLLVLCGFSSLHIGTNPLLRDNDSVDVLASTKGGRLLVVECTLTDLKNGNKLAKLAARHTHILSRLVDAKVPVTETLTVIVSAYKRDQLDTELEDAGKQRTAVVSRDEIQTILDSLGNDINADVVYDFLKELVPSAPYREPGLDEVMGLSRIPTRIDPAD